MAQAARGDGFDSEDEGFDLGRVARAFLWGAGAVLAVGGAVLSAQSETGSQRLALALNGLPAGGQTASVPAASRQARATPTDADARRLSDSVTELIADRDQLVARLEALERTSDVTGSIPAQPAAPPSASNLATAGIPSVPTAPQPTARTDSLASQDTTTESVATKTEFGVDLGRDNTLEGLRGIWAALKTQHAGLLDGLRPIVAVREGGKPGVVELRLVAGPLANAALAARLCATLSGIGIACQPATFDGQRLAMR